MGGAGGLSGHSVRALDEYAKRINECLARNGPRGPAQTPQSVELIQWSCSVTTMRKEREHGSTVTSLGGKGLFSRSSKDPLSIPYPTGKDLH